MPAEYTCEELQRLRDLRYHRTPELRVKTEAEALDYVNETGFCFLYSDRAVEIPTLWAAVAGSRRPWTSSHHDPDISLTWALKDSLPIKGLVHYGKLLRGKPTLVSLDLLPTFYALSPNYGDIEDYILQYKEGRLSAEAKNVYEALLKEGAMSTTRLRRVAGLAGGGANARRFDRAVATLQQELKITKVGISDTNRWGYAYVYDLLIRRHPDVPEQARAISTETAQTTLVRRYLRDVVAVEEQMARRLFRWDAQEWEDALERMIAEGQIDTTVRVEGLGGRVLTLTETARSTHE